MFSVAAVLFPSLRSVPRQCLPERRDRAGSRPDFEHDTTMMAVMVAAIVPPSVVPMAALPAALAPAVVAMMVIAPIGAALIVRISARSMLLYENDV